MALSLGWKLNEERDGAWKGDPAFIGVTPSALADWEKTGDAAHLRPFERNGTATVIKWRALNSDEAAHAERFKYLSSLKRFHWECFALGARFAGMDEEGQSASGIKIQTITLDTAGNIRLSTPVLNNIEAQYPGLIAFYGEKIADATFPTEAEKKASSPRSTPAQSPAAGGTDQPTAEPSGDQAA